jgi:hypothetical protein
MGSDDVRGAHMAIFQNLRPEGARIGELTERPSTPAITKTVRAVTRPGGKDVDWEKVRAVGAIIGAVP